MARAVTGTWNEQGRLVYLFCRTVDKNSIEKMVHDLDSTPKVLVYIFNRNIPQILKLFGEKCLK